jgi:hypothetical protein
MTCVSLTETGLLAIISIGVGFVLSFCKTAEQSRCKDITLCWGIINCKREPLSGETILQMEETKGGEDNTGR